MPTFQFLLRTSGIRVEFDDDTKPAIGFYTSCRARAGTSEQAFQKAMNSFDTDRKLADIFQSAHDAGLRPNTEVASLGGKLFGHGKNPAIFSTLRMMMIPKMNLHRIPRKKHSANQPLEVIVGS